MKLSCCRYFLLQLLSQPAGGAEASLNHRSWAEWSEAECVDAPQSFIVCFTTVCISVNYKWSDCRRWTKLHIRGRGAASSSSSSPSILSSVWILSSCRQTDKQTDRCTSSSSSSCRLVCFRFSLRVSADRGDERVSDLTSVSFLFKSRQKNGVCVCRYIARWWWCNRRLVRTVYVCCISMLIGCHALIDALYMFRPQHVWRLHVMFINVNIHSVFIWSHRAPNTLTQVQSASWAERFEVGLVFISLFLFKLRFYIKNIW